MILSEYFTDKELACKCGCGLMPSKLSIEKLYAARLIYGKPIKVNSGARCEAYNYKVGGSKDSKHMIGAFDVHIDPQDEWIFIKIAMECGFTGIGIKNNEFIHIDPYHSQPTIWTY